LKVFIGHVLDGSYKDQPVLEAKEKQPVIDKRFTSIYAFIATVRNKKELSKERCDEIENIIDGLFLEINE